MIRYTPKPKLCPCGVRFTPRGIQKYHSPSCELKYKTGKVEDENLHELGVPVLTQIARGVFQDWVKQRDQGLPCISCGVKFKKGDVIHAGHMFKAETHSWLVFHELNTNSQCDHCNIGLDGNFEAYKKGFAARYGAEQFVGLSKSAATKVFTKHGRLDLVEIIQTYKAKIKELSARKNVSGTIYDVKINQHD